MAARVERVVTSGTFALDGGEWEVDNNVWLVGDDHEVLVSTPRTTPRRSWPRSVTGGSSRSCCTHGHNDHINAAVEVAAATDAEIALHPADRMLWAAEYGDPAPRPRAGRRRLVRGGGHPAGRAAHARALAGLRCCLLRPGPRRRVLRRHAVPRRTRARPAGRTATSATIIASIRDRAAHAAAGHRRAHRARRRHGHRPRRRRTWRSGWPVATERRRSTSPWRRDWEAARQAGDYRVSTSGVTLEEEGFLHASFAHQWQGVRERVLRRRRRAAGAARDRPRPARRAGGGRDAGGCRRGVPAHLRAAARRCGRRRPSRSACTPAAVRRPVAVRNWRTRPAETRTMRVGSPGQLQDQLAAGHCPARAGRRRARVGAVEPVVQRRPRDPPLAPWQRRVPRLWRRTAERDHVRLVRGPSDQLQPHHPAAAVLAGRGPS